MGTRAVRAPAVHGDVAAVAVAGLGTILGVWAHPDDEAYLSAGLMAIARANGQRVVVVSATAGELGTSDPDAWPPDRLAQRRREEHAQSLAALGVEEHRVLGLPDGGCAELPLVQGADLVAELLDQVQPDTILTFGPEGMTGHPDHRAVSAWTTAAWQRGGRSGRLLHATLTPEYHETWGELSSDLGIWMDGEPPCTPVDDLAVHLRCTGDVLERKLAALYAHASQTAGLAALVGEPTYRQWWTIEAFVAPSDATAGR
jgi:LmbE family N-acetylglucosaminyl deacetylase